MMTAQAEYQQRWLQLAPKPPERGSNTYDVFISYRSSDRSWAMALHDTLQLAGWKPFLDQYALVPGANLRTSLEEALEASASGVILWSSRTKDSEWCRRERDAMDNLRQSTGTFNFIFAKLDGEKLPLFAQAHLFEDFTDSPEGPRGVGLLRLLCGVRGVPLSPEAVSLAEAVDRDAKNALLEIAAAREAGNSARLLSLGTSRSPGLLGCPAPAVAAAEALIRLGSLPEARIVLEEATSSFPQSVRVKQLEGLVLRRQKKFQEAIEVLGKLRAAGHQDPETLGMLGAAWDGLYLQSGKTLHLRSARELYRAAFQSNPRDYYTGINAASKSLFLGELDEAARLAAAVLPLVADANSGTDMWAACTLGEVLLLQRKVDEAAKQFQCVIDRNPMAQGDLGGTRTQALRICAALELSPEEIAKIEAPFKLLDD